MQTPCQVEVTPCKSEGIEPFTLVNSPQGQVEVSSSHLINLPLGQVRVTPCKSEGIEPFTLVNSPPGQVKTEASHHGQLSTMSSQGHSSQSRGYRALCPGQLSARSS